MSDLKEELAELTARAKDLGPHSSRLEAAVSALRIHVRFLEATQDALPGYPPTEAILAFAKRFDEIGFTLDELIAEVGPAMVIRPKRYKNALSTLLRDYGFTRRQVYREGDRPLVWFAGESQSNSSIL